MDLTDGLCTLLQAPSTCYLERTMADGSPQLTPVGADTGGGQSTAAHGLGRVADDITVTVALPRAAWDALADALGTSR